MAKIVGIHTRKETAWASYTPAIVGFGTVTGVQFEWKRIQDTLYVRGIWTNGTVQAITARIPFPIVDGFTLVSSNSGYRNAGSFQNSNGLSDNRMNILIEGATSSFTLSRGGVLSSVVGSTFNTGEGNYIFASAPIAGWTVDGNT